MGFARCGTCMYALMVTNSRGRVMKKIKQPEQQLNLIVGYLSFAAKFSQHVNVVLTL